jgi:hypothetical protein
LVVSRQVDLAFATISINPHIKRLHDLPPDGQVKGLAINPPEGICVYPSADNVAKRTDLSRYDGRPYTRRLALAEPQLLPVFFELYVLEKYFRDPRYLCHFGDRDGSISVRDEHYESDAMAERDKVLLQTFGIGYDATRNRVVVVFLRDLSGLSPEHQQIWKAHEVSGTCTMNSDYERASVWGHWPEHYSVYEAFIQEQVGINKLCSLIGKPPLFKSTFEEHRPIEFAPMLRPTQRNFQEFALTLDKMLSDNLSRDFFKGDIPVVDEIVASDGKVEVRQLGTITLLERWLRRRYRTRDGEDRSSEVLQSWKDVRKARQPIAHSLHKDEYDQTLPNRQDQLLASAIRTLQVLRLILTSHPKAKGYIAPEWLDGDKIVFY